MRTLKSWHESEAINPENGDTIKSINILWIYENIENGRVVSTKNHRCSCGSPNKFIEMATSSSNTGSISMTNAVAIASMVWGES